MLYPNTFLKTEFSKFLEEQFQTLPTKPALHVIQIGTNEVSRKYVGFKQKLALSLGSEVKYWNLSAETSVAEVARIVEQIPNEDGLIYQLPIPKRFESLVDAVPPHLDVDLLGSGHSLLKEKGILPPTIGAIDLLLKAMLQGDDFEISTALTQQMNLEGTCVGVIGQGKLVGTPVVRYLLQKNATIVSVNVATTNPEELIRRCDIVISAAGKPKLLTKSWLKPDAIVIDAATTESNNVLVGDVDLERIHPTNVISTTPKGVGGITVGYLFYNLLRLAESKQSDFYS